MSALFSRIKTWVTDEDVSAADINAEFDNILTNLSPLLMSGYSTNVAQMQVTTDPGEVGTESLATTLAGEIARLRYMINAITGEDEWYESPISSLAGLANAVVTGLTDNRIVSGLVVSGSQQPGFLIANGAARTVKLDGTPTSFVYYIAGTEYSVTTDITLTGLTAAPSTNNTCLINDSIAADQEWTKVRGENGTEIPVDAMGTEISGLVGKFAAFALNNGSATEYFTAYVDSATRLSRAKRGYFFDSSNAAIPRISYADNDTITLVKATWVFVTTAGALTATYNTPVWSDDEPTSPALGDYWFDYSTNRWMTYGVGSYSVANAVLIGMCVQDTTNTVAARSFEFFKNYATDNTIELLLESNTQVKSRQPGAYANVWGTVIKNDHNLHTWDITLDRDSGVSESASTTYYMYLTETGDKIISDVQPHDRREDLGGYYHTHKSWRCFGYAFNDGSSNLTNVESYFSRTPELIITPTQTAVANIEIVPKIIRVSGAGGAFAQHLPPAAQCRGQELIFLRTDNTPANAITLDAYASETINGSTTRLMHTQYESYHLRSDGTEWFVINHYAKTPLTSAGTIGIGATTTPPVKGTIGTDKVLWAREGRFLYAYYEYVQTAAGSGTAGSGNYLFDLPASLSMDTGVITVNTTINTVTGNSTSIGTFSAFAAGASGGYGLTASPYSATQFRIYGLFGGVANVAGSGNCALNNTTVTYGGWIRVPALNWTE